MNFRVKTAAFAVGFFVAAEARAASFRAETTAGLMQQPTSHYYHLVYGGFFELARDKDSFIARAAFIERPVFKRSGYLDQDRGLFGLIGTKIGKSPSHGIYPFFGCGRVDGYVRTDHAAVQAVERKARTYRLPGIVAALEYQARLGPIALGIGHQTFVGYVDSSEVEAFVAWPYNFYQLHIGLQL